MTRHRFPLDSGQLELLLAFEQSKSLLHLAETMAKDPSVVSRNLQRLAETLPVIVKDHGKWRITALGSGINARTRTYLQELAPLISMKQETRDESNAVRGAALLLINAQLGLSTAVLGTRSNVAAEANMLRLLERWRTLHYPIFHIPHHSEREGSDFHPSAPSSKFIPDLAPIGDELVIPKTTSSAFADTAVLQAINAHSIETLVIIGFTANECIDATARNAADLGFAAYVVSDATASFDVVGQDGMIHRADRIHQLTMANLHAFFAKVLTTDRLLESLTAG